MPPILFEVMEPLSNGLRPIECSFNDMKYIEIENDNLEDMIIGMVSYASTTAIPRYYVDNFEPPANTNEDAPIKIIATSTLSKYIGKIIKMIQYKFPMHEDFAGLDINKNKQRVMSLNFGHYYGLVSRPNVIDIKILLVVIIHLEIQQNVHCICPTCTPLLMQTIALFGTTYQGLIYNTY